MPDRKALRAFLANLEADIHSWREKEAKGWVYLVTDDEDGDQVHVVGLFPSSHDAFLAAAEQERKDTQTENPGWTYTVLPLFGP